MVNYLHLDTEENISEAHALLREYHDGQGVEV